MSSIDQDALNLENYKIIIQNFSVKGNTLYWAGKRIVSRDDIGSSIGDPYYVGGPTIRIEDGGTGTGDPILGIVKGIEDKDGYKYFVQAKEGIDYLSPDSASEVKNKNINAEENTITNITRDNFADSVVSTSMIMDDSSSKLVSQAAIKEYVQYVVDKNTVGQQMKEPAVAATTENISSLSSIIPGSKIDEVTLGLNDRVLVKDQNSASQNGIYTVTTTGLSRSSDGNSGNKLTKASVFVYRGKMNACSTWFCDMDNIILSASNIVWTKICQYPVYSESTGISVDNDTHTVSIDKNVVFSTELDKPIEIEYGGTGLSELEKNGVLYTDSNGKIAFKTLENEGLDIVGMKKEEIKDYLGIDSNKDITSEVNGGRSKLFYSVALGF